MHEAYLVIAELPVFYFLKSVILRTLLWHKLLDGL